MQVKKAPEAGPSVTPSDQLVLSLCPPIPTALMASQGDNTGFMASVGDKYQHCDTVFRRQFSEVKAIRKLLQAQWNFSQSANLQIDKLCPSSAKILSSHTAS